MKKNDGGLTNRSNSDRQDTQSGKESPMIKVKGFARHRKLARWLFAILIMTALFHSVAIRAQGQGQSGYITDVREIETTEYLGVASPAGLAYSPQSGIFQILDSKANGASNPVLVEMTMYEDLAGQGTIADTFSNPLNITINSKKNSLVHLNQNANTLDEIPLDASGRIPASAKVSARFDVRAYGLAQAEGMTADPADGTLYFLDPAGKSMIRVTPDANGNYGGSPGISNNRIQKISLKSLGASHLRGIAFNPSNGHLYVLGPKEKLLFEVAADGSLVGTYDVSTFTLRDSGAMVFAPSGDNTDDPAIQDLFIADSGQVQGQASGPGQILELSLTAPVITANAPIRMDISQVNVIQTSNWNPPSPDPSGLEFRTSNGRLFVVDSEVDEVAIFQGKAAFESTTTGTLTGSCSTTAYSKEVAGTAENADNPNRIHLWISDDGRRRAFDIDLGPDNTYCTGDDSVRTLDVFALYNDTDPEGLAYGGGKLFITDGMGSQVYAVGPGGNGVIGDGDDQVTNFDTSSLGLRDPEGIGYNNATGTLFIVSRKDTRLVETTPSGTVVNVFDVGPFNLVSPAGVGVGPGSQNPSVNSVYVSTRGVDNGVNPNENDGKIYEFSIAGGPPPPPPGPATLYLSFADGNSYTVGSVAGVRDEDILSFDGANYSMLFDGSDVGVGGVDVDAFKVIDANTILMSFDNPVTLPGIGPVADTDIVQFNATSLGSNTAGTFSMYFNGVDVGLDTSAEDIDGFDILSDGRLVVSTSGSVAVPGVSGLDEDLLAFAPTSLGSNTSGTWSMYFDGSDVGLADSSAEDTDAVDVAGNGDIYLSVRGLFTVPGISGDNEDVFVCTPTSLGDTTACNYSSSLFFDGSAQGVAALDVDGISLP